MEIEAEKNRELIKEKKIEKDKVKTFRLERTKLGELIFLRGEERTRVVPKRCFPWSEPGRLFSLHNLDGEPIETIKDVRDLDKDSREALKESFLDAGFVFRIAEVLELRQEFELRFWRVQTEQGERRFQTAFDAWPRALPEGDFLVEDVAGDLYLIPKSLVEASDDRKGLLSLLK